MQILGISGCILAMVVIFCSSATGNHEVEKDAPPVVELKQGKASGKIMKSTKGKLFEAFLGIPYGKVTERFTAAEKADKWSGVLDATKDGAPCVQINFFTHSDPFGKEDCLFLNVYTPILKPDHADASSLFPVHVYIYGGGFMFVESTSTLYGPERYMDSNNSFVLVLMNYRVGSFGFLSTNDEVSPGNYAFLDQVLALEWVRDNIHSFKGDKNRVTLSGESAGGATVTFHLLSPLSTGLFQRAITQSGSSICSWAVDEDPLSTTRLIAEKLKCPTTTNVDMVECLRKTDAYALARACDDVHLDQGYTLIPLPVVDGKFLTEKPLKLLKEGQFNRVPVIMGFTEDEGTFFFSVYDHDNLLPPVNGDEDANWERALKILLLAKKVEPSVVKAVPEKYFKDVDYSEHARVRLQQTKICSDGNFKNCIDKTIRLLSEHVTVYAFVFDYSNEQLQVSNYTGKPDVGHMQDVFHIFNYTAFGLKTLSVEAQTVSDTMVDFWANFVTFGEPTPSGPFHWEPSTPEKVQYLKLSRHPPEMIVDYQKDTMQFWDDIHFKN